MGWAIHYKAELKDILSSEEMDLCNSIINKWNKKLEDGCEYIIIESYKDGLLLEGSSKIQHSIEPEEDLKRIVAALKEIEKRVPKIKFQISEDYGILGTLVT